jgi:hypothetical protein
MSGTNFAYIIPPYLLNTCLGSELQKELSLQNEELSLLNIVSTDSHYYNSKKSKPKAENVFSQDPFLNIIIREKVLYKLALIGALGDNPMEFNQDDSSHLFELYSIFKHRLIDDTIEKDDTGNIDHDTLGDYPNVKSQQSLISSSKVGEIDFSKIMEQHKIPEKYEEYLSYSLKDLILSNKYKENHSSMLPPSFIQFGNNKFFEYPLPISWVPLVQLKHLNYLNKALNLNVSSDDGYASIDMSTGDLVDTFEDLEELTKPRYYNFISDKLVGTSTGIFYYEVEVEYEVTEATNFKPIIAMNDGSISSESSLSISTGFVKRHLHFEGVSPSSHGDQKDLDLEKMKDDIFQNRNTQLNSVTNSDPELFLSVRPGEFKGSFAVNFEDLVFYNSVRSSESIQRTALLNVNRRLSTINRASLTSLDSGKVDIGITFKTRIISETPTKRVYKTDPIGCGINFINKSIFITLNGVLAKVITQDELASSTASNDLFSWDSRSPSDNPVFPMLGFKLNDIDVTKSNNDPSSMKIKSNLGYKEFKFNIANYVKSFKQENQRFLYLSLLDKIQSNKMVNSDATSEVEHSLLNINEDSKMLIKLIKGYLNHEGYMDAFKSFNNDLENLSQEISSTEEQSDDSVVLTKTHATNRQVLKKYLLNHQFDLLLKFLSINYPRLESLRCNLKFEIKFLKFTHLMKLYTERMLNINKYEFEFEFNESEKELYDKAFEYRIQLQEEYKSSPSEMSRIDELSTVFLIKGESSLNNLPKAKAMLNDFQKNLVQISSEINVSVLQSLGMKKKSNLEQVFQNVNNNIITLSLGIKDDKFMLVNFEKDHMDL